MVQSALWFYWLTLTFLAISAPLAMFTLCRKDCERHSLQCIAVLISNCLKTYLTQQLYCKSLTARRPTLCRLTCARATTETGFFQFHLCESAKCSWLYAAVLSLKFWVVVYTIASRPLEVKQGWLNFVIDPTPCILDLPLCADLSVHQESCYSPLLQLWPSCLLLKISSVRRDAIVPENLMATRVKRWIHCCHTRHVLYQARWQ